MTRCLVMLLLVLGSQTAAAGPRPEPAIEIRGNRALAADVIRGGITADQATLVEPNGDISQEAVERAALIVASVYWEHGYANVRVAEPTVDRQHHRLEFTIKEEGPKFSIAAVRVTGDLLRTERAFQSMFAIKPGHVFSRSKIARDRDTLQRFYEDRGYAFVNVLPLTKVDLATKTIGLTFEIEQGELAFVDKLTITGNTRTPTQTILDVLSIEQGEPYHRSRLEAARQRLRGMVREVVVATKRGSTPASIEIVVEVDE